jgi:hypothetical protein
MQIIRFAHAIEPIYAPHIDVIKMRFFQKSPDIICIEISSLSCHDKRSVSFVVAVSLFVCLYDERWKSSISLPHPILVHRFWNVQATRKRECNHQTRE